jgi:hypothetical protein
LFCFSYTEHKVLVRLEQKREEAAADPTKTKAYQEKLRRDVNTTILDLALWKAFDSSPASVNPGDVAKFYRQ